MSKPSSKSSTPERIVARIEKQLGVPDLVSRLATEPSASDLATLMVRIQRERALSVDARRLFETYQRDPFVAPCGIDARRLLWLDAAAFDAARDFDAIEVSPLAALGTCTAVAPVDPANIESTARGREVLSDPSNVLALEAARRRKGAGDRAIHLCASARVVRTPRVNMPGFAQHFRLFALCSAGRAEGKLAFELAQIRAHLWVHLTILGSTRAERVHVTLVDRGGRAHADLERVVVTPLTERFPDTQFSITTERASARSYYPTLSLTILATDAEGRSMPVGDGGAVEWTAKVLSDRKERCIVSGLGLEVLCTRFGAPM